jgi:putative DNA primase/helicase
MGENFFDFENTVTPILLANHLPEVSVGGTSFWRRARKLDFDKVVLKKDENVNLVGQILALEGPGILQWIIDGAVEFLRNGEQPPEKVTVATRQYQLEEDVLARFFDEILMDMDGVSTSREGAYDHYKAWCVRQSVTAWPFIRFAREIVAMRPGSNVGNRNEFVNITLQAQRWGVEE